MKLLIRSSLLCLAILLTGCANVPSSIEADDKVDETKGVLLAAITADHHGQLHDAWYYFRRPGVKEALRLSAFGQANFFYKKNDYPDHPSRRGRLLAIPLEPGEYELFSWTLYINTFGGYGFISPKNPPPPVPFSVKAGRVTYLGSLHIDTILGRNMLDLMIAAGGNPDMSDNFDVDLAHMKKKFPSISMWPIDRSVPPPTTWKLR